MNSFTFNTTYEDLIILKIGGSYLTEKTDKNQIPQLENLHLFCKTLKEFVTKNPTKKIILAHGAGSLGHVPAHEYSLQNGFHNEGNVICEKNMHILSSIICQELIKYGLLCFPFHPINCFLTDKKRIVEMYLKPMEIILQHNCIPVIHGDVCTDISQGSCILSADQIVPALAQQFGCKRIGFICNSDVKDNENNSIKVINESNFEEIKKFLFGSKGFDVTGGMKGKIEELMFAAKNYDITSFVFDDKNDNLLKFLEGEDVGTKVCKN